MRKITDHTNNPANEQITIEATDDPGDGGANHAYAIRLYDSIENAITMDAPPIQETMINFQKGPIFISGVNGITNEALLAIVIDRMRGFQSGKFMCRENALALTKMEEALMWLQKRTMDRMRRGVEGTHQQ